MPIRFMVEGDAVEELIGWDWKEGSSHPKCVLSGNYRDKFGNAIYDVDKINKYIKYFLKPLGKEVGEFLLEEDWDVQNTQLDKVKSENINDLEERVFNLI